MHKVVSGSERFSETMNKSGLIKGDNHECTRQTSFIGGGNAIIPSMRLTLITIVILFLCGSLAAYDLYVNPTANPNVADGSIDYPYNKIQDAIDHAVDNSLEVNQNGPSVVINLYDNPSIYPENLQVYFVSNELTSNVVDITIKSISNNPEQCKIRSHNPGINVISVWGHATTNFTIRGVTIEHSPQAGTQVTKGIDINGNHELIGSMNNLTVDNCIFNQCTHGLYYDTILSSCNTISVTNSEFILGSLDLASCRGITVIGDCNTVSIPLIEISGCKFISEDPSLAYKGIDIGKLSGHLEIVDNEFTGSTTIIGNLAGWPIRLDQQVDIQGNTFMMSPIRISTWGSLMNVENNKFIGSPNDFSYTALFVEALLPTAPVCWIKENIFIDVNLPLHGFTPIGQDGDVQLIEFRMIGNSFIGQGQIARLDCNVYYSHLYGNIRNIPYISEITNNLYTGSSDFPFEFYYRFGGDTLDYVLPEEWRIPISYSHFNSGLDATNPSIVIGKGMSSGDPLIDYDSENHAYSLLWNESVISPLIDGGCGDKDPDGTPPEIGAVSTFDHDYWEYTFSNQADQEKWYWVSYPVLNNLTSGVRVASEFFKELLLKYQDENNYWHPTYLQQIDWMEGSDPNSVVWNTSNWSDNQHIHYVSSPQGYKIKLLPRTPLLTLRESGFRTPTTHGFQIYGRDENEAEVENWLGYYKKNSAFPHEAFADIWDDINMIKTKNWCLVRPGSPGNYWGLTGKIGRLNYGDMVVVTTNSNHTFHWSDDIEGVPPSSSSAPERFSFDEKQDYTPVYVSIPDSLMADLKEIGLYLDGVCKGAVVVESNVEQICAYLGLNEKLTDGVVDFVFYYDDNKSQHQERKTIRLDSDRLGENYVRGSLRYVYYNVTLTPEDMENTISPGIRLNQNYPNPFNPSTTISYNLPEAGQVKLEIFNLRGQLVQVLTDSQEPAGEHRKVWNGTDQSGNAVASGVYFYRLITPARSICRRMLLMK